MAGIDVNSPGLFAGLDADLDGFGLTDNGLGDGGLADGGLGTSPDPNTVAPTTLGETPTTNAGTGARSGTSLSPSADTAASHTPQQPNFFSPVAAPQWAFQDTPPV